MCLGFGTSAWLSRLPDVRDDLGLTPATIGTMLLIASLGSLLTLPTSGPIVTKIGARASGRIGVAIWALGIVCAGIGALNVSIPLATLGLVLLAAGNGLWGATGLVWFCGPGVLRVVGCYWWCCAHWRAYWLGESQPSALWGCSSL